MLNKFWGALGTRRSENQDEQWFQKDGATPHTANITMESLDYRFPNQLINMRRETKWSLHSVDLTTPNFYPKGFLEENANENNPQSIAELKVPMNQKIRKKSESEWLITSFDEFKVCHQCNGAHLVHVL